MNRRPPAPEAGSLTRLAHSPTVGPEGFEPPIFGFPPLQRFIIPCGQTSLGLWSPTPCLARQRPPSPCCDLVLKTLP